MFFFVLNWENMEIVLISTNVNKSILDFSHMPPNVMLEIIVIYGTS